MRKLLLFCVLCAFSLTSYGQLDEELGNMEDMLDDAMAELDKKQLTLRFFHAITGEPIVGAYIKIDGADVGKSDFEGKIRFTQFEDDGKHGVQVLKDGLMDDEMPFTVEAGTIFQNRISVSPKLSPESLRVVLDWGKSPRDLDANLVRPNEFHISYRHKRYLAGSRGQLDRDDMDGEGPETITVTGLENNGVYTYYVHNYSDRLNSASFTLSESHAVARVYLDGRLYKTFQVPQGRGVFWHVFSIMEGGLVDVNQLGVRKP